MAGGLSHDGTLYAAPFYGESSMIMYRTDLMAKAGLEMPAAPSWNFIAGGLEMTDRDNDINGIAFVARPAGARAVPSSRRCPTRSALAGSTRTGMHSSTPVSGRTR